MRIGYVLTSAIEPDLECQRSALEDAGCNIIIADEASENAVARPGLDEIKRQIVPGDTLVVWRLDRLAYSMRDLITWVTYLGEKNVELISIYDAIDTSQIAGQHLFHLFGALANFERNLTRGRTQATLLAARSRGEKFGRPTALSKEKRALAVRLYRERKTPVAKICNMIGISKPTLYSYVRAAEAEQELDADL